MKKQMLLALSLGMSVSTVWAQAAEETSVQRRNTSINNSCQTMIRNQQGYGHLRADERSSKDRLHGAAIEACYQRYKLSTAATF